MKKYFPVLIIIFLLFGKPSHIKGQIVENFEKIQHDELEIKIQPVKIDKKISYSELHRKDRNKDGFINQLDDNKKLKFEDWKDILYAYLEYLNKYQPYDTNYQYYRKIDLNLNYKIEEFEEVLFNKCKDGKENEYLFILKNEKDKGNITEYQFYRASYALLNYFGHYQKKLNQRKVMAEKYPQSPFKVIEAANYHSIGKDWFTYTLNANEPEWLLSEYFDKTILPRIHHYYDYLEFVFSCADKIFPNAFSSDFFMQKLTLAVIWELEISLGQKINNLKMTFNEKGKKNLQSEIKLIKDNYSKLDILSSYLTKIRRRNDFISEQVEKHRIRLRIFEKDTSTKDITNFNQAVKLLQDYFKSNPDINKNDYHFAISALLKNHIENLKNFKDYGVMYSPDMMFAKRRGVCADQSPASALMLRELTEKKLDARLYCWYRRYFHAHISMIYQNYDGLYYILDQEGIQPFHYSSRNEAIQVNAPYANNYRESISINSSPGDNKSWVNIFMGKEDTITSPDDKLAVQFDKITELK